MSPERLQGSAGNSFDLEEWASIEDGALHVFISIWSVDRPDIEVNADLIVYRPIS